MCKCCCHKTGSQNIVYLFNSAFRGTYSDSLFKIMGLPNGLYGRMRYKIDKNVPEGLRKIEGYRKLINHSCFVLFVNRYHTNNYEFIPLRKGVIKDIYKDSGYLFIEVELENFLFAKDGSSKFTNSLVKKLKEKNIPELRNGNPKNTNDGNYIVESTESIEGDLISNDDSWINSVDYMTKALNKKFTFVKINLYKGKREVRPDLEGVIVVSPNCKYILDVTYFDPTLGKGKFYFNLGFQTPLATMQNKIYCTSSVNNVRVPISSGKNISLGYKSSSIQVSQIKNDIEQSVLTIPCKVEPISKDKYAIGMVVTIFILAILAGWKHESIWFSLIEASKWLVSLILLAYAGWRIF